MKICWDNLDILEWDKEKGLLYKDYGYTHRYYKFGICKQCNDEYLYMTKKSDTCCLACSNKLYPRKKINMIGRVFGDLTVLKEVGRDKQNRLQYKCLCNCGNEHITSGKYLRNGDTKSCGCRQISFPGFLNSMFGKCGSLHPNYIGPKLLLAHKLAANAKRRAQKLNQTPILTDNEKAKIQLYYTISRYLGKDWHVDHIQPLSKGGLHHPDNLQVVTKRYNLQKNNKLNFREPKPIEVFRI